MTYLYSRELSQKVRAAKKQRAEQGLFLSPFAPYGYRKDQDNRNHLVIDGPAAEIVRRIFQMTLDGVLPGKIAASLNREGVMTPMVYKHNAGVGRLWPSVHEENFCTDSTVTLILKDERYIGNVIYGRRTRTNIGHWHSKPVGRDGWVVREDMHEGIVSKEDFARAQGIVSGRLTFTGSHITKSPALLKGKVFCGVCGHAMRRQKGNAQKYHCYTPAVTNEYDCPRGHIPEGDILDAVLEAIRQYARLAVQLDRLDGTRRAKSRREKKDKGKQFIALQNEKSRLDSRLQELYEQFVTGDISKETYLAQKSSIVEREQEIADETGRLERLVMESTEEQSEAVAKYIGYAEVDELTQEMLSGLLKRVYVYPGNVLEIQLNYTDELGRLQSQYDIGT